MVTLMGNDDTTVEGWSEVCMVLMMMTMHTLFLRLSCFEIRQALCVAMECWNFWQARGGRGSGCAGRNQGRRNTHRPLSTHMHKRPFGSTQRLRKGSDKGKQRTPGPRSKFWVR